jgi:hypothetical protein
MCPIQIGHRSGSTIADLYSVWKVGKQDRFPSFGKAGEFTVTTRPTAIQQRALDLLGVKI